MHTFRNHIIHGPLDQVIVGKKAKNAAALDIRPLKRVVHGLAILKILNPHKSGNRHHLAERLLLREPVQVIRI